MTDSSTGAPVSAVCVTLGPSPPCWTRTDASGRYVINLTEVGAQSGTQWEMLFYKQASTNPDQSKWKADEYPPYYAVVGSGKIVVSGVVTKNMTVTRQ